MRSILYSFILICCFASVNLIAQEDGPPHAFKQSKKLLNGTWHVVATNCSELVNSDKDTVKLVFSNFKIKNGKMTFDESLIYYKSKSRKIQKANNLMKSQMQLNFIWTGLGNFDVMNRKWRVIASDSEGKWLVVQFFKTKTKFKGIAVIVRDKNISEQQLQDIITYVARSYLMPSLTPIK